MNRLLLITLLLLSFGCSQNHFNIPRDNFTEKVKVLGVAPIMIDADSDIKHPNRDLLIPLVAELNRKYEMQFVRKLKESGSFSTVALLDGDPRTIFNTMLFRRENRDDANIQYNKYFWREQELKYFMQRNNLDAVMLIVVSGISRPDKLYVNNVLSSQTADYNVLIMTAQILDANGTILWEYPNFRRRILSYDPMINLQYPDLSESEANLKDKPDIKFRTIEGIRRALDQRKKDLLRREMLESEAYSKQFDEMLSLLEINQESGKASEAVPPEKAKPRMDYVPLPPVPVKPVFAEPVAPAPQPVMPVELPKVPAVERPVSPFMPLPPPEPPRPVSPPPSAVAAPQQEPVVTPLAEPIKIAPATSGPLDEIVTPAK